MKNILLLIILFLACTGGVSCSSYPPPKILEGSTNKVVQQISDSIKLVEYSIHLVKLPFPYTPIDQKGEKKTYTKAWLVLFQFEEELPVRTLDSDFYIGSYHVPEYGGWKRGIYFRIYESALFEKLRGKEILIQGPFDKKPISTRKVFQIKTPLDNMELEDEDRLLERK